MDEETINEQTAETGTSETVEELEDRLVAALERNEHLEERIQQLETRLATIEGHSHAEYAASEHSHRAESPAENPPTERQPDKPPKHPHIWFRDVWKS